MASSSVIISVDWSLTLLKIQQVVLLTQKFPVFPNGITAPPIYCFVLILQAVRLWNRNADAISATFLKCQKAFHNNWQGLQGREKAGFTLHSCVCRIMQVQGKLFQKSWPRDSQVDDFHFQGDSLYIVLSLPHKCLFQYLCLMKLFISLHCYKKNLSSTRSERAQWF